MGRKIFLSGRSLEKKVYQTPQVIDDRVAEILLATKGVSIDKLTEEQEKYVNSWDF